MPIKRPRCYALTVCSDSRLYANGITYYIGSPQNYIQPTATAGIMRIFVPRSGFIRAAIINMYSTTIGTGEDIVMVIRVNNTTDYPVATIGAILEHRTFTNYALHIPVDAGDFFEVKITMPTWVTPPTGSFGGHVIIDGA